MADSVKLLLASPDFYKAPPKKIKVEDCAVADRTYFIFNNKIVAVADRSQEEKANV